MGIFLDTLLIRLTPLPQPERILHLLNPCLPLRILASIIGIQYSPLLRQRYTDTPRMLVIHDIRPDLPNLLGRTGIIQEIVLDLKVFSGASKGDNERRGVHVEMTVGKQGRTRSTLDLVQGGSYNYNSQEVRRGEGICEGFFADHVIAVQCRRQVSPM